MGSGKSSLSQLLANHLGYHRLDTDLWISDKIGLPIHQIIETLGWDFFRKQEKELPNTLILKSPCVIATGGGFVKQEDNFQWLKRKTTMVYLHVSPEIAVERTLSSSPCRPLLDLLSRDERLALMSHQYLERDPVYARAEHRLNGELSLEELLLKLVKIATESEVE